MSLEDVIERIRCKAIDAGRIPSDIELVAVSKMQPDDRVDAVLKQGHRVFGENRVQEALKRWRSRRDTFPDLRLHLIGPLQTNKAAEAVEFFDVIQSIDRRKLLDKVSATSVKIGRCPDLFIQVNTGNEEQKAGVSVEELPDLIDYAVNEKGLKISGLMAIPPVDEDPAPHFALLKKLADRHDLRHVSIGMSGDYETAIELGATCVRVGSAIFGERQSSVSVG